MPARFSLSLDAICAGRAGLPWSTAPDDASTGGTGMDVTYIALNKEDLNGGKACGSCLWFRGTGKLTDAARVHTAMSINECI